MHDYINEDASYYNIDSLNKELEKYITLASNGQSAIETNKLLTEKFNKLLKFTKQALFDPDIDHCKFCKHFINCEKEKCPYHEEGTGMEDDKGNKYPDMKWTCMDFNYGTCRKYEEEGNADCRTCKNGSNWEWADSFN